MPLRPIDRFVPWFYAAAVYNALWGFAVLAFSSSIVELLGLEPLRYPALFQVVGMIVGVYAIGYWLLAKDPVRYCGFIWIGLAGKVFGPVGFLWYAARGELPWQFGWTLIFNDLIWWPAFFLFAVRHARSPLD